MEALGAPEWQRLKAFTIAPYDSFIPHTYTTFEVRKLMG